VELFTIQCTTCRARLKVNDESVIGDILGCPKCGSMVQVVPPSDWRNPAIATGEFATGELKSPAKEPAEPAQGGAKKTAAAPPALPRPTMPERAAPPITSTAAKVPLAPPLPKTKAPSETSTVSTTMMLTAATPAAVVAPSSASIPTSRLPYDWKLLAGGLAGGVALGLGAWLTIVTLTRAPQTPALAQVQVDVPSASNTTGPAAPRDRPASAPEATEDSVVAEEAADTAPAASSEPTSSAAESAALAVVTSDNHNEPLADSKPAEPARSKLAGPVGIKLEPARPEPVAPQEPPVASAAGDADAAPLEERLPGKPVAKDPPLAEDSSGALPARALTADEIDERLSGPLPKVRFVKVPLAQFIDFVNDFSGLAIVIDERALAKVSKNRQTPVTVRLADTTARDALRAAVNSLGLTCVVRDGQLVVTAVSK
jgi:hypothetical protein